MQRDLGEGLLKKVIKNVGAFVSYSSSADSWIAHPWKPVRSEIADSGDIEMNEYVLEWKPVDAQ